MAGKHVEAQDLPYGVCIGLRGCFKLRSNKFHTDEIYLPKPIQQNPVRKQQEKMINSGSRFSNSAKSILVMSEPTIWMIKSLVIHFAQKIQGCITESISAVIIVGGPKIVVEELEQFDEVLANLSANIETYVLPSSSQESQIFPGKPYSSLYLPKSRDSLTRCYDPQVFET